MRILYYLEPYAELEKPLFRLPTVRNHLDRETQRLLENRTLKPQIAMLCSHNVATAVRREGLLANVQLFTLTQAELRTVYPDYLEASARWYNRDFEPAKLQRMMELCRGCLGSFEPDVILCYESSAPFLQKLFPRALFLHNTLGMFSRSPYPETSALDPFGIGKDAFLRKYAGRIRDTVLSDRDLARLGRVKERFQLAQLEHSPLSGSEVRAGFERVALLPLQVSKYFMFDENCPQELRGKSQLDLVRYVLERVDSSIGVYVTMHGAEVDLFTEEVLSELRERFPNFLFSERVQRMRWVSQHVLPHVDAVISVSSSVGLQAMVWDVPVVSLGRSHLTAVASSESLSDLPRLVHAGRTRQLDGALYYLLNHYYPLMEGYHHRGKWFGDFLERGLSEKERGFDFDFFQPIDDPDVIAEALIDGLRPSLYQQELRFSLRQGGPAVRLPQQDEVARAIADSDLVSFDVFDTLITRPLIQPKAVFDLVAPQVQALLAPHAVDFEAHGGFRRLREEAAKAASRAARASGVEEYDLTAVYEIICTRVAAPLELVPALKRFEESVELAVVRPRATGMKILQQALDQKKRVILISDTYLDIALVSEMLSRCGVVGYAQLYTSSEHKVLKRTGNLYHRIRELEGQPARWVHYGDNRLSDVQIPSRLGIHAHLMPSVSELYAEAEHIREIWRTEEFDRNIGAELLHGVVSRKFYDQDQHQARFEGSAYRLGYEGGGPLLLSFATWILERARRDKVTDLYFLSRDGFLPKQICEMLAQAMPEAPRAHYLYASRRAYSVAALHSMRDVARSLEGKSGALRLSQLLSARFGVDPAQIAAESLEATGFGSIEDVVTLSDAKQRARLEELLTLNAQLILGQASEERSALLAYLNAEGLFDESRRVAVVDIGHHASLQVALSRLTSRRDLNGYYFSTFYPAHGAYKEGLDLSSYFVEFEDPNSAHVYSRNVGMFEFLFLPALPSLMRMKRAETQTIEPEFVSGDESKRFQLIAEVHRGVLDFCEDVLDASQRQPDMYDVSRHDAARTFSRFVTKPSRKDAELLEGVSFVDAFGGAATRFLIASPFLDGLGTTNMAAYLKESWWKPGAQAMVDEVSVATKAPARGQAAQVGKHNGAANGTKPDPKGKAAGDAKAVAPWQRKLRKFLKDPQAFARDNKVVRSVRKVLRKS